MLRIGVTGHRSYDEPDAVAAAVDRTLGSVAPQSGPIEVWSSLAEGADRLVAERAIDTLRATLVVVLPLDPEDYRTDFADPASVEAFDRLLARADRVTVTGADESGHRTSAYRRAGLEVASSVDLLLAVWDGEPARGPGGTAEIVAAARDAGTRVVVVPVTRAPVRS